MQRTFSSACVLTSPFFLAIIYCHAIFFLLQLYAVVQTLFCNFLQSRKLFYNHMQPRKLFCNYLQWRKLFFFNYMLSRKFFCVIICSRKNFFLQLYAKLELFIGPCVVCIFAELLIILKMACLNLKGVFYSCLIASDGKLMVSFIL